MMACSSLPSDTSGVLLGNACVRQRVAALLSEARLRKVRAALPNVLQSSLEICSVSASDHACTLLGHSTSNQDRRDFEWLREAERVLISISHRIAREVRPNVDECLASIKDVRAKLASMSALALQQSCLQWLYWKIIDQCTELSERLSSFKPCEAVDSVQHLLALSREQRAVAEFPHSIFLQGRSGTGKTLCIVHRIQRMYGLCPQAKQLVVTRSALLQQSIATVLNQHGITTAQQPDELVVARSRGVMCLTWSQVVGLLAPHVSDPVDYTLFLQQYWPRLQPHYGMDPLLVWAEFHNRLRSFDASRSLAEFRHLQIRKKVANCVPLQDYLEGSTLAAVGVRLDRHQKREIHRMFRHYVALKGKIFHDETDIAAIVRCSTSVGLVDALYVDEAQDFSPAELCALMSLCSDPDGVMIAGDTCQTINEGSAFSFKEVMNVFREQIPKPGRLNTERSECSFPDSSPGAGLNTENTCASVPLVSSIVPMLDQASTVDWFCRSSDKCEMFNLRVNYRSTPGIIGLANDVCGLLASSFPASIDVIEEELVPGHLQPPTFVHVPPDRVEAVVMGVGAHKTRTVDPVSAAVLVRSEVGRARLRECGIDGTVLTIAEAKGLEFDFVIICDFFRDCPAASPHDVWRIADEGNLLPPLPSAIAELKSLYVAITRARYGCAMVESGSAEVWRPMIQRWLRGGLVVSWSNEEAYRLGANKTVLGTACVGARIGSSACLSSTATPAAETGKVRSVGYDDKSLISEVVEWTLQESRAREGKQNKKARSALAAERSRLLNGGPLDTLFTHHFQSTFGQKKCKPTFMDTTESAKKAAVASSAPPSAEMLTASIDAFSILQVLEQTSERKRLAIDGPGATRHLLDIGNKLLNHALDKPRMRWRVFMEARNVFREGTLQADERLRGALAELSHSRSNDADSDSWHCASHSPQNATWKQVVCELVQVNLQPRSWRSSFRLPMPILERILNYVTPGISEFMHAVEHLLRREGKIRADLRRQALLAEAWFFRFSILCSEGEQCVEQDALVMVTERTLHRAKTMCGAAKRFEAVYETKLAAETYLEALKIFKSLELSAMIDHSTVAGASQHMQKCALGAALALLAIPGEELTTLSSTVEMALATAKRPFDAIAVRAVRQITDVTRDLQKGQPTRVQISESGHGSIDWALFFKLFGELLEELHEPLRNLIIAVDISGICVDTVEAVSLAKYVVAKLGGLDSLDFDNCIVTPLPQVTRVLTTAASHKAIASARFLRLWVNGNSLDFKHARHILEPSLAEMLTAEDTFNVLDALEAQTGHHIGPGTICSRILALGVVKAWRSQCNDTAMLSSCLTTWRAYSTSTILDAHTTAKLIPILKRGHRFGSGIIRSRVMALAALKSWQRIAANSIHEPPVGNAFGVDGLQSWQRVASANVDGNGEGGAAGDGVGDYDCGGEGHGEFDRAF